MGRLYLRAHGELVMVSLCPNGCESVLMAFVGLQGNL